VLEDLEDVVVLGGRCWRIWRSLWQVQEGVEVIATGVGGCGRAQVKERKGFF